MRKFLVMVVVAATLAMGVASAQDTMMDDSGQWFGVSTGFPVGLVLHYGLENLFIDNLDLRANLSAVTFLGDYFFISVGADALYDLNLETVDDLPLEVYAGGGLNLGLGLGDTTDFDLGARGLAGAEYMLTDQFGAFGEVRVGVGILQVFRPSLAVGVNFHF